MRVSRAIGVAGGIIVTVAIAVVGWDFLQIGRRPPAPAFVRADRVVVEKAARRLTLLKDNEVLARYPVALGAQPVGHKQREGDGRTPEGVYAIDFKHPNSRFHLALRISYPGAADRAAALARGVPPGGDIMIHGLPNGLGWFSAWHLLRDWTDGCVAVTNGEIEDVWARVDLGTQVEIKP